MIIVSAWYAITDLPMNVVYMLLNVTDKMLAPRGVYSATMFISFLYICTNPFIYAVKFEPVKRVLLGLIPCKKTPPVQPTESVARTAASSRK